MAFKRSAVRSRLSPPKTPYFFSKCGVFPTFCYKNQAPSQCRTWIVLELAFSHDVKGRFSFFEQRIQFLCRIFLDLFLHMLVMLRHIHICVPCQALNGFQWYALRLKLQNISVPAAMGWKESDLSCGDQRFLEMLAEYAWIADGHRLPVPDVLLGGLSEFYGNFPKMGRNRNSKEDTILSISFVYFLPSFLFCIRRLPEQSIPGRREKGKNWSVTSAPRSVSCPFYEHSDLDYRAHHNAHRSILTGGRFPNAK